MVLELLRSATRAGHVRVEAATKLLPGPTRERYAWFLAKLYGFHSPFEAAWEASDSLREHAGDGLAARRRVPLLIRDLRALGLEPGSQRTCRWVPDLASAGGALGALYVTEGSTLGGQVVARLVSETLGIGPDNGAAFLTGHGPRTRAMWGALCETLEAFGANHPREVGELVGAAVGCFAELGRWLEEGA